MQVSTSLGMAVTWAGAGGLWLAQVISPVAAGSPPDAHQASQAATAAIIGWPAAVVSIGGMIVTVVGVIQKILEKRIDDNRVNIESVQKELADTKIKAELAEKEALRLKAEHRRTKRRLRQTAQGLKVTRQNRHDALDNFGAVINEVRVAHNEMVAAINTLTANQEGVMKRAKLIGSTPPILTPLSIDIPTEPHADDLPQQPVG